MDNSFSNKPFSIFNCKSKQEQKMQFKILQTFGAFYPCSKLKIKRILISMIHFYENKF